MLVDLQPHAKGGHFQPWFRNAVEQACKAWQTIVIYTKDQISSLELLELQKHGGQVLAFCLQDVHYAHKYTGDILGALAHHQETRYPELGRAPFFIMWAQQFLERSELHRPIWFRRAFKRRLVFDRPWGSLFSLSTLVYSDAKAQIHPLEARLKKTIHEDGSCVGVLVWDENAASKFHPKCIHLPDVEVLLGDDLWSGPINCSPVLGSVGQLWGYRSMNLLAEILESEPEIHGFAAGSLFPKSYSRSAKRMVLRQGERFSLERGFVPDDAALHQAICRMDGFVLDSRSYKAPSGLAIRAMAAGRPIVTIDRDSWIARHVKSSGVGVFWQKGRGSLRADLREWFESGGPARSKALAGKLSDQAGMEAAFAEMFRRLKEAAAEN